MGCKPSKSKMNTNGIEAPLIAGGCLLCKFQSARVADEPAKVASNIRGQFKQSQHDQILAIPSSNVTSNEHMIADVEKSLATISEWKFSLSELYSCLVDESKNIPHPTVYQKTKSLEYSGDKVKEMYEEYQSCCEHSLSNTFDFGYTISGNLQCLIKLMKRQPEDMDTMPQGIRELSKECNAKVKSIETLKSGITFGVGTFQICLVCTGIALPVVLPIVWAVGKIASESAKMAIFFCETKLKDIDRMNNNIQEVMDKICSPKLDSVMVALETKLQTLVSQIEWLPYCTRPISFSHIYGNDGLQGNTNRVKRQVKVVEVVLDKIEKPVLDLIAYMKEQI